MGLVDSAKDQVVIEEAPVVGEFDPTFRFRINCGVVFAGIDVDELDCGIELPELRTRQADGPRYIYSHQHKISVRALARIPYTHLRAENRRG